VAKTKLKIVYIGASNFGLSCLKKINLLSDIEIVGIITGPSEFNISYSKDKVKNVLYSDFHPYALKKKIPIETLDSKMNDPYLLRSMEAWNPDLVIVVGWYHMIPKKWLQKFIFLGMHASLLPRYSGGAPLVWAMINGEQKTGITLFKMDSGVDSGPILNQGSVRITQKDTIKTLYKKIESQGIKILIHSIKLWVKNKIEFKNQIESDRTIFPQRSPEDGLIDWDKNASEIDRFIRAQTKPYPGAYFLHQNKKIIIWTAFTSSLRITLKEPGSLILYRNRKYVAAKDSWIRLEKFEITNAQSV
jgi:methionyl-tRNA formyltransferase